MLRAGALAATFAATFAVLATPAMAFTSMASSEHVALIPGNAPSPPKGDNGIMPISSYVSGNPSESFDKFSFTDVALNQITTAELSHFDTVALTEVKVSNLSSAAKAALSQFVANGGKLIIQDADQTSGNDYSWILSGSYITRVGGSCNGCGSTAGSTTIVENSALISANPSDPSYVNTTEMGRYTDAIGDSNLLVSNDSRWFDAVTGSNGVDETGAQLAYASSNGLVIYNGFDTDMIKTLASDPWRCIGAPNYLCQGTSHESVDWLAQMWYDELNKGWQFSSNGTGSSGLPQTTPVSSLGTPVLPTEAGLPSSQLCVAKRTLFLRLEKLVRAHRGIVQIDVYVNGRHVLVERTGHLRNVTLKKLPKKGNVVVKVVATTKKGFRLISKVKYHPC